MEEAAVISGVFRLYRMPEASNMGAILSARRFIQYSSEPPLTYGFQSCVDGDKYIMGIAMHLPKFTYPMKIFWKV